jgi:carboxypeptidase T
VPYLSTTAIEGAVQYLAATYPTIVQLIALPEQSVEGRTIHALKIANGSAPDRRGVLFIGGVHARELVNPDALITLASRICQSYTNNVDIVLGGKTYPASTVKLIVDGMDVFMLPLVNPDGRTYVQAPSGDPWWRKNRGVNAGSPCLGVDLNRNFDFLHASGIGTSSDACSETFRGPAAFSEPETRNVRWMLDNFPNIRGMMDVHSYSELVLHPWGDDDTQTTDPAQNFHNPAFDGLRGTPGDSIYREYMLAADQAWFVNAGNAVRDAIAGIRGRNYTVEPAVLLYPTSGTSKDYSYARHIVDTGKAKVFSYTLETGREFQPPDAEAAQVINEVCAGVLQLCLSLLCLVESVSAGALTETELGRLRKLRDDVLAKSSVGRQHLAQLVRHTPELIDAFAADEELRARFVGLLREASPVLPNGEGEKVSEDLARDADALLEALGQGRAGSALGKALRQLRSDLKAFPGRTVGEGLKELERARPVPQEEATRTPPPPEAPSAGQRPRGIQNL